VLTGLEGMVDRLGHLDLPAAFRAAQCGNGLVQ
jgi:hypothetical protein